MKLFWLAMAALVIPLEATAQSTDDEESLELYVQAVRALLGDVHESVGTFYLAAAIRGEGSRTITSDLPESVVDSLTEAGYRAELAELGENGLWQVPRNQLFLMVRQIDWLSGRKLARFSIDVGSGGQINEEVAFTFLRDEAGKWALVEKGPREGGP